MSPAIALAVPPVTAIVVELVLNDSSVVWQLERMEAIMIAAVVFFIFSLPDGS
jgi:hypothetical protein